MPPQPTITAFADAPDRGRGLARDLRVRWALEEVGQPYEVRLLSFQQMKEPAHRALQPFGQIPTYEEGGLVLFETGAIVLHIAQRHGALLPRDEDGRARAVAWMFAALNTVEPPLVDLGSVMLRERDRPWFEERRQAAHDRAAVRYEQLSEYLSGRKWLEETFSVGDLMMIGVLFRAKATGGLVGHARLSAYVARGEARPAFGRAFAAQQEVFRGGPAAQS